MVGFAGVMKALFESGVLDCATYVAGLSGSTWSVFSWPILLSTYTLSFSELLFPKTLSLFSYLCFCCHCSISFVLSLSLTPPWRLLLHALANFPVSSADMKLSSTKQALFPSLHLNVCGETHSKHVVRVLSFCDVTFYPTWVYIYEVSTVFLFVPEGTCPRFTPTLTFQTRVQWTSTKSWWKESAVILCGCCCPNTSPTTSRPCGPRRPQGSLLPSLISLVCS